MAFNIITATFGLRVIPLSVFAIILNLKPILVIIIGYLFGIENLSTKKILLILISFIGAGLIVNPDWFAHLFNSLLHRKDPPPQPINKEFERGSIL
jgi:drug/metabolite transporter (DMT)-like permease